MRLALLAIALGGCGVVWVGALCVDQIRMSHQEHEDIEAMRKDGGP